jgi:hypothetical protein
MMLINDEMVAELLAWLYQLEQESEKHLKVEFTSKRN